MDELKVFKNQEFGSVRALVIDKEPWFVANDTAKTLGYKNPRDAISKHVDDEDKGVAKCDTLGGRQDIAIINESGLYSLILSSKLPSAKKFKRWVTSEVLPTLRKTGQYQVKELSGQELMAKALIEAQSVLAAKDKQIEQMKPKALFADAVASSSTSILIGQLAKILTQNGYKTGQNRLFARLREEGYLSSRKGNDWNMPQQRYVEQGLFKIKESTHLDSNGVNITTKTVTVTGKGQIYFLNKFVKEGTKCSKI